MPVTYEEDHDEEKADKIIAAIAENLGLEPDSIKKYMIIAYDGTEQLKAGSDLEQGDMINLTIVFLEHLTGMHVELSAENFEGMDDKT